MTSIDLASAMKSSEGRRFTTRPLRIALVAFLLGYAARTVSAGVDPGDLGAVFDRIGKGVEAVTSDPTPTTVAP